MLTHLNIRNFALVERAELELHPGMTVLTGETGAGKSILIDAVGLAVGERASAGVVRTGASRAEVVAVFDLTHHPEPSAWLAERDLDHETECIVRRTVAADGRSRAFINDRPVPAQTLRELGELLVDIHGQHAHQSLLRRGTQRDLLDAHGRHQRPLAEVERLYREWRELEAERERYQASGTDPGDRLEFLRFQVEELSQHEPDLARLDAVLDDHRRLSHSADIDQACGESLELLTGDAGQAVSAGLGAAVTRLQSAQAYEQNLEEPIALLLNASAQVDEAAGAVRRLLSTMDSDTGELARIDAVVGQLHELSRKHRVPLEALPECLSRLQTEIDFLATAAERQARIDDELRQLEERYRAAAEALHKARHKAGRKLAAALQRQIRELGMDAGVARIDISADADARPTVHGLDTVEFEFSANPGAPPRPLAQVASGGELSRIGLAIQVIASGQTGVGTFIFDEVDAGIGGRLADLVGARLAALAEHRQVLCVTHLPQVAAHAHQHVRVAKRAARGVSSSAPEALTGEDRIEELARMLGGTQITERTLAHARELLTR